MSPNSTYWMNYAIRVAQRAPYPGRRVGVALVSEHNELICSAFDGEVRGASWYRTLRSRIQELGTPSAHSIYLTINTLTSDRSFELAEFLKEVRIDRIYIGLPDPALTSYLDGDPVTARGHVHRFPDDLQREILEQNRDFYAASGQNIECNPHYSTHRISEAVSTRLRSRGFALSRSDVNANRGRIVLASLICQKYGIKHQDADRAVNNALSEAFDAKYGTYDYAYDARAANLRWTDDFMSVYGRSSTRSLSTVNILNVGVGSGYEATALFSDCSQITFVDIAERGLANISGRIPSSKTIVSSAEDLSALPENFVDLYRGMDTANLIGAELDCAGFKDIRMFPTSTEIYLSAVTT